MQNANEFMISSALTYKISYIYENNGLLTSISHVFPHSSAMLSFSLFFFFAIVCRILAIYLLHMFHYVESS